MNPENDAGVIKRFYNTKVSKFYRAPITKFFVDVVRFLYLLETLVRSTNVFLFQIKKLNHTTKIFAMQKTLPVTYLPPKRFHDLSLFQQEVISTQTWKNLAHPPQIFLKSTKSDKMKNDKSQKPLKLLI